MRARKDALDYVLDEERKCGNMFSVWVLMKDGAMKGNIILRYTRGGGSTRIMLRMEGNLPKVYGYEVVAGCSYEGISLGISEILRRNVRELEMHYDIKLPLVFQRRMTDWVTDLQISGYKVVRVI